MNELLKLHWEFFRLPTLCLEKYVRNWPVKMGLGLYAFFLIGSVLMNTEQLRLQMDLFAHYFENINISGFYGWIMLSASITLFFTWYITPFVLRLLIRKSKDEFDANLYRKLVFYSPIAFVVFSVICVLPVKIAVLIFAKVGMEGTKEVLLLGLLVLLERFLFLWAGILVISSMVVVWKGLEKFFDLNAWQIILIQFIVPSVIFIPIAMLRFPNLWGFIKDYATAR